MNSQDKKERFLELRIQGETFEKIAKELAISKQTLINWSKEKDIQNALQVSRLLQYQSIINQFEATKRHKIEFYSELSLKIKNELKKQDFSMLTPEKLLEIILKCDKKLSELVAGKVLGGESIFEDWGKEPSFYFNPEE